MNDGQSPAADKPAGAGSKSMQVLDTLKAIVDPAKDNNVVSLGYVKNLSIQSGTVKFDLVLPDDSGIVDTELDPQLEQAFAKLEWVTDVQFGVGQAAAQAEASPPAPPQSPPPQQQHAGHRPIPAGGDISETSMPNVKHVIAVGSGKGGVGKSTVSVNLALALAGLGNTVGLMDADVYGPSVPLMLGISDAHPLVNQEQKLLPLEKDGLHVMSMGFLMRPDQAVVWRGPMIHGVIRQFLTDVDWGDLDYLIVDLPPGTGDAPLSLIQALPLTASIVVTTPQEVASSVAQKAMSMFERMGIHTLGIIENMSYFICPDCSSRHYIFGEGGGQLLAKEHKLPLLGEIPLDLRMRKGGDAGLPVVLEHPDSELAEAFRTVAKNLVEETED